MSVEPDYSRQAGAEKQQWFPSDDHKRAQSKADSRDSGNGSQLSKKKTGVGKGKKTTGIDRIDSLSPQKNKSVPGKAPAGKKGFWKQNKGGKKQSSPSPDGQFTDAQKPNKGKGKKKTGAKSKKLELNIGSEASSDSLDPADLLLSNSNSSDDEDLTDMVA